jgi:hypothetical protein
MAEGFDGSIGECMGSLVFPLFVFTYFFPFFLSFAWTEGTYFYRWILPRDHFWRSETCGIQWVFFLNGVLRELGFLVISFYAFSCLVMQESILYMGRWIHRCGYSYSRSKTRRIGSY